MPGKTGASAVHFLEQSMSVVTGALLRQVLSEKIQNSSSWKPCCILHVLITQRSKQAGYRGEQDTVLTQRPMSVCVKGRGMVLDLRLVEESSPS